MMMRMLRIPLLVGISTLAAATFGVSGPAYAHQEHAAVKQAPRSAKASQTAAALRDLWVGHIFWVRNVTLATFNRNDAALKAAEQHAVANAQSIAAAIEPFYGAAAKDALFKLLAGHYGAVKAYLVATAAGDPSGQSKATEALSSNASDIAAFLSKANSNLPKDAVNGLLLAHGGHHIQQIQELKDANYAAEAKTWEEMKTHMYVIADAMADALVKQFAKGAVICSSLSPCGSRDGKQRFPF
jgi:hypothetical protein